jgi:hypothetical protein
MEPSTTGVAQGVSGANHFIVSTFAPGIVSLGLENNSESKRTKTAAY